MEDDILEKEMAEEVKTLSAFNDDVEKFIDEIADSTLALDAKYTQAEIDFQKAVISAAEELQKSE